MLKKFLICNRNAGTRNSFDKNGKFGIEKKIPMHGIRYSLFILTEVLYRFGDATCYMERHFQSIQMGVDVLGGISLVFNVITSNL